MKKLFYILSALFLIISCQVESEDPEELGLELNMNKKNKDIVLNELPNPSLFYGFVNDVNNQGILVGDGVWINNEHSFLDSGTGVYSEGNSINNQGQIAGIVASYTDYSAAFWDRFNGNVTVLPKGSFALGYARDINDQGIIVGFVRGPGTKPALWINGELTVLPIGDYTGGWAEAINNSREIVGWVTKSGISKPVIWKKGRLIPLDDENFGGQAWGINNQGQVVGTVDGKPALWDKGELIPLPKESNIGGTAFCISNSGKIVGIVDYKPAFWEEGKLIILPNVSSSYGEATGVNETGMISGHFDPGEPVFWTYK